MSSLKAMEGTLNLAHTVSTLADECMLGSESPSRQLQDRSTEMKDVETAGEGAKCTDPGSTATKKIRDELCKLLEEVRTLQLDLDKLSRSS